MCNGDVAFTNIYADLMFTVITQLKEVSSVCDNTFECPAEMNESQWLPGISAISSKIHHDPTLYHP